jgi:23S rRNA-/tRNA-specific pseudouridylate synthase
VEPQTFVVTERWAGERLDRFLQAMIPRMSRAAVQQALATRVSLSSGLPPKASRRLVAGEEVKIAPREATGPRPAPPVLLVEGAGWAIADKPPGMPSVPSARHPGVDAATVLGLAPAHRLDRFTSGCLLLTRTRGAARHFAAVFEQGLARKVYAAVVRGLPEREHWDCEAPIGPDEGSRVPGRMAVLPLDAPGARPALTRFRVVVYAGSCALVAAWPATGRRHQVRVHAASSGHPMVGDLLYGGDERDFVRFQLGRPVAVPEGLAAGRHLLHARVLEVPVPEGGIVRAVAPWPDDFAPALTESWLDDD